jgi:transcription initiation factor TFIIB
LVILQGKASLSKRNEGIGNIEHTSEDKTCPLCKQYNTIIRDSKSTEIVCSKCGMVVPDKIDMRSEWQTVDREEMQAKTRTGPPLSLARHDIGLSTVIGKENIDASKNKINPSMLSAIYRLRNWDLRTQNHNHTLRLAFSELDTLKDKLGLSEPIVERAAYIFRKAHDRGILRGRSSPAVLAAAIYIACRQMDAPRTLNEIAITSNIRRKSITRYHRVLLFKLELKLPIIDNKKCIARVANEANISEKTKHQAINLMSEVIKRGISTGKDPMGLAAAVLYASCIMTGEQRSQIDLARAAQTTGVTIRNRFKDLANRLELHD